MMSKKYRELSETDWTGYPAKRENLIKLTQKNYQGKLKERCEASWNLLNKLLKEKSHAKKEKQS